MSQFSLLFVNAWRRFTRLDGLARDTDPRSVLVLAAILFGAPGAALGPLPVPPRRLLAAHAAALLGLLTAFTNAPSLVLAALLDWTGRGLAAAMARQAAGIGITATIAFGSVLALRSLSVACNGRRGLSWIGPMAQMAGLVAVVSGLLLVPRLWEMGPAWRHGFDSPLPLAGWAVGIALCGSALYVLAARRAFRPRPPQARGRHGERSSRWFWNGSPARAAVTRFATITLTRCRRQRMIVGGWFAIGAAVVLASDVGLDSLRHAPSPAEAARVALSVPVVLAFFLLAGLRNSFVVPAEVRANWIFRLCTGGQASDLIGAGRLLMGEYLAVLLLAAAGYGVWLWPAHAAFAQVAFLAAAGALWIQCLTWNLHKIPFTCSYQPGGANLIYAWPFYALFFSVGAFDLAGWEQWLLAGRWRLALALTGMLAALAWSERYRDREAGGLGFMFDDAPDPAVQTLLAD